MIAVELLAERKYVQCLQRTERLHDRVGGRVARIAGEVHHGSFLGHIPGSNPDDRVTSRYSAIGEVDLAIRVKGHLKRLPQSRPGEIELRNIVPGNNDMVGGTCKDYGGVRLCGIEIVE